MIPMSEPIAIATSKKNVQLDIEGADRNPETFLSNFMTSRAWIPTEKSNFKAFESDDEDEEQKAEAFEEAYNFRFEDPNKINEVLVTHSRDTTSKFSVRREMPNSRKKRREAERLKKTEEKKEREAERARLRKLRIEELTAKVNKIKKAAGIREADITEEDWAHFLEDGWDGVKWEQEMEKRFGEDYYAQQEDDSVDESSGPAKKRQPRKPKWDDDIDVNDL